MTEINQQLIADELGMSRTTVSRCFTNHPGINPDTRARVFALAAKLGYNYIEPRTGRDSPRMAGIKTMGVLICSEEEEYNRPDYESPGVELMPGISEFALLQNLQLDVHFANPNEQHVREPGYRRLITARKKVWSGLILMYPFPQEVIEALLLKFPCVSLVEQYGVSSMDCVDVDHYKGISQLMDKLMALGHRRIGFFSRYYPVEAAWAFRRYSAYVEKMARYGIAVRQEDVINVDPVHREEREQSHERAFRMTKEGVTAWICAADHQAYDLISALQKRGLKVPRDVSVTGFDGILRPTGLPELTTVKIPYRQIGYMGAKRLYDLMGKRFDAVQHILLECQLQKGETVAPVSSLSVSKGKASSKLLKV
jgi:DNA-binding LacI/PurR family transcriptional regulator